MGRHWNCSTDANDDFDSVTKKNVSYLQRKFKRGIFFRVTQSESPFVSGTSNLLIKQLTGQKAGSAFTCHTLNIMENHNV